MKMIAVALLAALGLSGCIAVPVYEPGYRSYGYYGGGGYYRPYGGYHRYRDRYP
jgi:hypothetical protein